MRARLPKASGQIPVLGLVEEPIFKAVLLRRVCRARRIWRTWFAFGCKQSKTRLTWNFEFSLRDCLVEDWVGTSTAYEQLPVNVNFWICAYGVELMAIEKKA